MASPSPDGSSPWSWSPRRPSACRTCWPPKAASASTASTRWPSGPGPCPGCSPSAWASSRPSSRPQRSAPEPIRPEVDHLVRPAAGTVGHRGCAAGVRRRPRRCHRRPDRRRPDPRRTAPRRRAGGRSRRSRPVRRRRGPGPPPDRGRPGQAPHHRPMGHADLGGVLGLLFLNGDLHRPVRLPAGAAPARRPPGRLRGCAPVDAQGRRGPALPRFLGAQGRPGGPPMTAIILAGMLAGLGAGPGGRCGSPPPQPHLASSLERLDPSRAAARRGVVDPVNADLAARLGFWLQRHLPTAFAARPRRRPRTSWASPRAASWASGRPVARRPGVPDRVHRVVAAFGSACRSRSRSSPASCSARSCRWPPPQGPADAAAARRSSPARSAPTSTWPPSRGRPEPGTTQALEAAARSATPGCSSASARSWPMPAGPASPVGRPVRARRRARGAGPGRPWRHHAHVRRAGRRRVRLPARPRRLQPRGGARRRPRPRQPGQRSADDAHRRHSGSSSWPSWSPLPC